MIVSENLLNISRAFKDAGFTLFIVGGAVRDFKLGREPKDFDLVTDASPQDIVKIVEQLGGKTMEVGMAFGIVFTIINNEEFEIASFRGDEKGASRQEVVFKPATIVEDSERRDLCFNAMFFDIQTGHLIDLTGGMECLENKIVKTVGTPRDRFLEDPIRILRVFRFAAALDFEIDSEILETLKDFEIVSQLKRVSKERVVSELTKIVSKSKDTKKLFHTLNSFRILEVLFDGVELNSDINHTNDITQFLVMALKDISKLKLKFKFDSLVEDAAIALTNLKIDGVNFTKVKKFFNNNVKSEAAFCDLPNKDFLKKLFEFGLDSNVAQELIKQGFKGSEISKRTSEIEFERFQKQF